MLSNKKLKISERFKLKSNGEIGRITKKLFIYFISVKNRKQIKPQISTENYAASPEAYVKELIFIGTVSFGSNNIDLISTLNSLKHQQMWFGNFTVVFKNVTCSSAFTNSHKCGDIFFKACPFSEDFNFVEVCPNTNGMERIFLKKGIN